MNPEELKQQAEDEGMGIVHDDDVAPPMPCGDGCEGCPDCTADTSDDTPPEIEQPQEEEIEEPPYAGAALADQPEVGNEPPETDVLQGFNVEITETGEVRREFYGKAQNITLMLGLVKLMEMEVEQRQRLQRGFPPSAEMTAMAGIARAMQNMGNVLIQMQGGMMSVNETMKAGFNECRCECQDKVESIVDADAE